MDFTYILHTSSPDNSALLEYGFSKADDIYTLKTPLFQTDFYTIVTISPASITAELFENAFDDKYTLIDVPSAQGAFVGELREKITLLIEEIHQKCFITTDIQQKYLAFIKDKFGVLPEYPWDDLENMVFRCPNDKWFGLIMRIPYNKLGISGDENKKVWVVNLKADADKIPDLIDNKSIFPAWHMSKKYWITVLLTTITDFNCLCKLTERSYELVTKKTVKKD